jgi:hypothetical protein
MPPLLSVKYPATWPEVLTPLAWLPDVPMALVEELIAIPGDVSNASACPEHEVGDEPLAASEQPAAWSDGLSP